MTTSFRLCFNLLQRQPTMNIRFSCMCTTQSYFQMWDPNLLGIVNGFRMMASILVIFTWSLSNYTSLVGSTRNQDMTMALYWWISVGDSSRIIWWLLCWWSASIGNNFFCGGVSKSEHIGTLWDRETSSPLAKKRTWSDRWIWQWVERKEAAFEKLLPYVAS